MSKGDRRPQSELYAFSLRQPIPSFPLPLNEKDIEPIINLQNLFHGVYDRARYHLAIDYTQKLVPNLSEVDAVWVDELLREQGLIV